MSKKKKKNTNNGIIYSTNPDYSNFEEDGEQESIPNEDQTLEVHIEKKGRGGKTVIIVKGFIGSDEDLNQLAKLLKSKCGVGGSAKDGEILIQGDKRDKVMEVLQKEGFTTKRVGG